MDERFAKLAEVTRAVSDIVAPVWAVGGCVRDSLLGREVHDWDFTTPSTPNHTERAAREAGRHPYLAGKRFGTVGFKLPPDVMRSLSHPEDTGTDAELPKALYVEVTTFRSEAYEPGSRKPAVEFGTSLEADLSRRDFTINAMAFDGSTLIDPFGGQADLEAHIIRAVGDPIERLREDPLRILRAARFAAQLGFSIDERLAGAMLATRTDLANVSHERWLIEMDKLLAAPTPGIGLDALLECGALRLVLPEVAAFAQVGGRERWGQMLARVAEAPVTPDARWAALLSSTGIATGAQEPAEIVEVSVEIAHRTGYGLRWPKARHAEIERLIRSGL